jgi:cystathionine beta-lyase
VQLIPDVMAGILELLRVISRPGDEIVINSPVYPPFARTTKEAERTVDDVPLIADANGWTLDFAGLERAFAAGARFYLFCSPHNPIGRVWTRDELTTIAHIAKRYDVTVLSDEIHAPITLHGAAHTVFSTIAEPFGVDSVVITAASKAFNIAGLKSAQIVAGSDRMLAAMKKMPPGLPYAAAHLGVLASRAAFREGDAWLDELNAYLDGNRMLLAALLAEQIPAIGYRPPQAGYLAWLDCSALGIERDLAPYFLERGRIALSRGADFGPAGIPFVRLNIGTSGAMIREAVGRMRAALDR